MENKYLRNAIKKQRIAISNKQIKLIVEKIKVRVKLIVKVNINIDKKSIIK